jgi:membrane protein implicated in regulation of membrane protease activity
MVFADLFLLALAIVVAVLVIQSRRARQKPTEPSLAELHTAMLRDEVQQLRERIQVLERVITDNHGSVDLTQEIDRLRDR